MNGAFDKIWKLKPPVWVHHVHPTDGSESWWWSTVFCNFNISKDDDGTFRWSWCIDEYYQEESGFCYSLEEAQELGVQWYLGLILKDLEPAAALSEKGE